MNWIDLKDYGAELKRVVLPNEQVFPALIINDVEKYNASGAIPIQQLRENNPTPFEKLGGDAKGRPLNKPIFYLSNSFEQNQSKYALTPALSKLLQVPESKIVEMFKPMNESDFTVTNGLGDFEKFNQINNKSTQTYMGKALYIVREKQPTESLISFAQKLEENQHPLYQKNNVANFPFETLDSFGFNTDIIERAFMNPQDALKAGVPLPDLQYMQITDQSILPISMNKDLSINLITHASDISQLSYTNHKWQKNIPIIEDYNALLAVREATRTALNAKQIDVNTPEKFNNHINNIAVALQNFNETSSVHKTHKPIKYENQGITTMLTQNKQGEWRYIEKNGSKKLDEPLTLQNFQKALTAVAKSSFVLSEAMSLKPNSLTFDEALHKVLTTQSKIYKSHTLVVNANNIDAPNPDGKVVINELGDKVNIHTLNSTINTFQRDNGSSLASESIKSILGDMRSTERGTINDIMGGNPINPTSILNDTVSMPVDPIAKENPTPKVTTPSPDADPVYLLDIADEVAQKSANTQPKEITFKVPLKSDFVASNTPVVVEPTENYTNLPKGIAPHIDESYDQVNDAYRTIQHIATASIPYWSLQLENAQSALKDQDYNLMYKHEREIKSMLNQSSTEFGSYPISTNQKESLTDVDLETIVNDLELILTNEKIKENMLALHLKQCLGEEHSQYGVLALKSDKDGNYIPFANQAEYDSTVQKLKNNAINDLQDQSLNGLLPTIPKFESNAKTMVDNFVNEHYNNQKINYDQINNFTSLDNRQIFVANFASVDQSQSQPILPYSQSTIDLQLIERVSTMLPNNFGKQSHSIISDMVFSNGMTGSYSKYPPTNSHELNQKFFEYEKNPNALSDLEKFQIIDQSVKNAVGRLKTDPDNDATINNTVDALMYKTNTLLNSTKQHLMLDVGFVNGVGSERFLNKLSASFLLNTQALNDPSNQNKDGVFAYATKGEDAYKVVKVEEPKSDQIALRSTTYADALKEVFVQYQAQKIQSELGILDHEVPIIKQLAKELSQDPKVQVVNELTNKLTGGDTSSLGKALEYNFKLGTSVALAYKIAGVENDQIKTYSLISKIDDLTHFKRNYDYLSVDFHEATRTAKQLGGDGIEDKPTQLVDNAVKAMFDHNKADSLKISNNNDISFITILPTNDADDRYSRIVPTEWLDKDKPNPHLAISTLLTDKPFPIKPLGLHDIAKEHAVATIPEPKNIDHETAVESIIQNTIVEPTTTYADKFQNYRTANIEALDPLTLSEKLNKDTLWNKASISDHILSNHQNLDTMMLSNAIHSSLNKLPTTTTDQMNINYRDHYTLLKQVHDVVSNSKDNEQLLNNFYTFAQKTTAQNPSLLQINPELPLEAQTQTIMLNCMKNASFNHVVNGVNPSDAINQAFTNNSLNAHIVVEKLIVPSITEIARHERLSLNEKSFVNYLDGITLNAQNNKELSNALTSRISDAPSPNANPSILDKVQLSANTIIPKLIEDINNSINPTSEKELKQNKNHISEKWNITIQADGLDRDLFTKKQLDKIEDHLTKIQNVFGIQNPKSVGNGMVIDVNTTDNHFVKDWAKNLINASLDAESANFTDEQRKLYVSKNPFNSPMVEMVKSGDYQPVMQSTHTFLALSELTHKQQESKLTVDSYIRHSAKITDDALSDFQYKSKKTDSEFGVTNKFIAFTVAKIESNQSNLAQAMAQKAKDIQAKNPNDLYDHKVAMEKQMDSILNPKITVSQVAINKFIETEMPTIKGKEKDELSDLIKAQFEMAHDVRDLASSYLSSKGANHVIQILIDTAPESVKSSDQQLINEIDKRFGALLGESSNLDAMEKGDSFAVKYNTTEIPFDHEAIVAKYVSEIVNNSDKYNIPDQDKERAKQLVSSYVDEVHNIQNPQVAKTLDKDKENSLDI